jgi:hypothetical protein
MKNLLTIETIPIRIEYIKKEETHSVLNSGYESIKKDNSKDETIRIKPMQQSGLDQFKASSDYQWNSTGYKPSIQFSDKGEVLSPLQVEEQQSNNLQYKQASHGIDHMVGLLSDCQNSSTNGASRVSIPYDMTRFPSSMSMINIEEGQLIHDNRELKVTQRPKVIIKYVGGPIYCPPSADPHYVEPSGFNRQNQQNQANQLDCEA